MKFILLLAGMASLGALTACNINDTVLDTNYTASVKISYANSIVSVSTNTIASGTQANVTLTLKDTNFNSYVASNLQVSFQTTGGTSTGTFGAVTDNHDGSYSTTFMGGSSGTATAIHAFVDGNEIQSSAPTIRVGAGSYSLSLSTLAVSAGSVNSGSTLTATLTVRDSSANPGNSGLIVTFSNVGGSSTGSFGSITDHGDGTYSAVFTGVTAGTATTVRASIQGQAITSALPTIIVNPGSASAITISTGDAQSGTAGAALGSNLVAVVKDTNTNVVSGVTVSWAVTGGGGSVSSCTTTTDASGLVHCAFTTGTLAGTNTVTASVAGIATSATFTETGTAGAATSITVSSGDGQSGTAGSALASNLVGVVKDNNSNVVSGVSVSWAVTGGGGSVSSCTTTTDVSGFVHCKLTTGTVSGTNTVTASVAGIAISATFTETGTAGAATAITVSSGSGQSGSAGVALGSNLVAVVKDTNANVVPGVTVSWAVTGGGGSVSSCTTVTDASGLIHCSFATGNTPGTNTVTASVAGIATSATFTEYGTILPTSTLQAASLRRLVQTYVGALIRVRRSSDNAEQDIYADSSGNLDTVTLLSFVGSNDGFVKKLYDQTGNGNDFYQNTTSSQAYIVQSGSLILEPGTNKVSFYYPNLYGGNGLLSTSPPGTANFEYFGVWSVSSYATGDSGEILTCAQNSGIMAGFQNNTFKIGRSAISWDSIVGSLTDGKGYVFGNRYDGSHMTGSLNGVDFPSTTATPSFTAPLRIMGYLSPGQYYWHEVISGPILSSADRASYASNAKTFWGY